MPNCLECGTELEYHDSIDTEFDGSVIVLHEVGHCPKCGKDYKWRSYYEFDRFDDVEKI